MSTDVVNDHRENAVRAPDWCPLCRSDVTVHELDGEGLIFDGRTTDTHRLNETALGIWQACDGTHDARRIAELLTTQFDVSLDDAMEHVGRFLALLDQAGLFAPSPLCMNDRLER